MSRSTGGFDGLRPRRYDLLLVGVFVAMVVATIVLVADTDLRVVLLDRTLDVAVTSWSMLMAGGLALLTLPRYRDSGRLTLLLQVSAFLVTAVFSAFSVAAVMFRFDFLLGMTRGNPMQMPLYLTAAVRLTSANLFLLAGIAAIRRMRTGNIRPRTVLLAPIAVIIVVAVIGYPLQDLLPRLIDEEGIHQLVSDIDGTGRLIGITPLAVAVAVGTVLLLFGAAFLFRTVYVGRGPVSDGFLAVGLVVLAFAELQAAFYPSVYTGLITASDLIRLLAYGVFLLGIGAEQRSDLRALREAYATLDRLRISEAERAALEERSHLAREIHDGLAQHLWFAKLKFERLAATVPDEDKPLAGEVGQALDSAIVEARQALVTMRTSLDTDLPLSEMLKRTVDDFGQRSGLRVTFSVGAGLPTALPPRQQIEVLRVVQEALTNVRKHADATVVRVRADTHGRDLMVSVADNGKGFDPNAPGEGLGLQGMEERARLLGGMFRITSEPQGGTIVELTVPMLIPDWLPTVTGSAAETAAEVAEAAMAEAGIPTSETTPTIPVPEAARPPDTLPALSPAVDASRPLP
ncbi:MAG: sensor histidine kinase [Chloroflexota bacterium]